MSSSQELKTSLFLFSCALLAWMFTKIRKISAREPYLPPGPPTTPLLGNLDVFPTVRPWLKFTEWAAEYGEIYSLKVGPNTAIVLTGVDVVKELMDKRSTTTGGRPKSRMADMITDGLNYGLQNPSHPGWRAMRKTAHAFLSPQALESHLPIQRAEAVQLLHDILETPKKFYTHIGRYSNSVAMSVLYGKRSPRYDTYETKIFYEVIRLWIQSLEPWAYPPIDLLPILNYIPERWASWKRFAQEVRRKQRHLYFTLLEDCEKRVSKGEENGCYIEAVLAGQEEYELTRDMIGYMGGVLLDAGTDTTSTFLDLLVLYLIAFPEVQQKAQKEIDAVIGPDRLPSLSDISELPYIQALIKETHRLRPVTPIQVPHASLATEEYCGYIIPEGATIFVNLYGIYRSPEYFETPDCFNPDRFMTNEFGTKPGVDTTNFRSTLPFGCGRRICPGMGLANNSLMLNTMNLLWAFDFRPPKDSEGRTLVVDVHDLERYNKEFIGGPKPFDCIIAPRNDRVAEIIEREFENATEIFVKFERDLRLEDKKWVEEMRRGAK